MTMNNNLLAQNLDSDKENSELDSDNGILRIIQRLTTYLGSLRNCVLK